MKKIFDNDNRDEQVNFAADNIERYVCHLYENGGLPALIGDEDNRGETTAMYVLYEFGDLFVPDLNTASDLFDIVAERVNEKVKGLSVHIHIMEWGIEIEKIEEF